MRRNLIGSVGTPALVVALAWGATAPVNGQGAPAAAAPGVSQTTTQTAPWTMPRTPDGQPDLQGIWTNLTLTPLERPASVAGKQVLTESEIAATEKQAATR